MTLKKYLKHNTAVREGGPPVEIWTPPQKSKGLRHFKFTSKGNSRGAAVIDDVSVESESGEERRGTLVIRARPDTLRVIEQTPRIDYFDADGNVKEHTFDLKVFMTSSRTVAIDFKPSKLVTKSGIREQHRLMAPQMTPRDADEILIMTPRMYSSVDNHNARLMHAMARQDYPDDDENIRRLVARMMGPAPIADLVRKSRIGPYPYGFGAVVRAISAGRLRVLEANPHEHFLAEPSDFHAAAAGTVHRRSTFVEIEDQFWCLAIGVTRKPSALPLQFVDAIQPTLKHPQPLPPRRLRAKVEIRRTK